MSKLKIFLILALIYFKSIFSFGVENSKNYNRLIKLGASSVLWVWSESQKSHMNTESCQWCNPPRLDTDVRDKIKWGEPKKADDLSNIMVFGVLPLTAIAAIEYLDSDFDKVESYYLLSETVIYSSLLNQFVKFTVKRERPYSHFLSEEEKKKDKDYYDQNLSFYSGHTNMSFAISATLARLVFKDPKYSYYKWSFYGMAGLTAYLRIAADKHYFTDVLVGALSGTLFSYGLLENQNNNSSVMFLPNSIVYSYAF